MIRITDPQGVAGALSICTSVTQFSKAARFSPEVLVSASLTLIAATAHAMPESRSAIAAGLRQLLTAVESGELPNQLHKVSFDFSRGEQQH